MFFSVLLNDAKKCSSGTYDDLSKFWSVTCVMVCLTKGSQSKQAKQEGVGKGIMPIFV